MSMNNENNPHVSIVHLGSITADVLMPALHLRKKSKILSVKLMNGAGVAADNTDYVLLQLKKGSTVIASLDTRAAGQGALSANVAKDMPIVSGQELQDALSDLSANYDESGTVGLTDAKLMIEWFPL